MPISCWHRPMCYSCSRTRPGFTAMPWNTGSPCPIPASRAPPRRLERAARTMRFPVVIKPPRRSPEWMRATVLVRKIRQWPPDTGEGCLAVETSVEEVTRLGLDTLQRLGYVGIGSFQFKKDADTGRFYMIEMNTGRPVLNMPICELCGVEMIHSYYCAAAGLPLPESRTVTRPGGKWICWKTDLASAYVHWRRGDLTVREWIASLRGRKWSADIQADDFGPFFADLIGKLARGFRRLSS